MQADLAKNLRILQLLILCIATSASLLAQNDTDAPSGKEVGLRHGLVKQGKKALENGEYKTADSLLSQALSFWGDEKAYLLRAETRIQLGNRAGFCSDLKSARTGAHQDLFKKECERADSIPFSLSGLSFALFPGATNVARRLDLADGRTYLRLYNEQDSLDAEFYFTKEDTLFVRCDSLPLLAGSAAPYKDHLAEHLVYPPEALESGIQGKVYVNFIVDKNGTLRDVRTLYSAQPILATEALRLVHNMKDWEPARYHGRNVSFHFVLPVAFNLR